VREKWVAVARAPLHLVYAYNAEDDPERAKHQPPPLESKPIMRVTNSSTSASMDAHGKVGREIRASTSPCSAVQISEASRNGSSWAGASRASRQRRTAPTRLSNERRPGV
jgi:hypothetical protein